MANDSAQVTSEGTFLERKIFEDIKRGINEKLVLLNLITDVTALYKPAQKSFTWFQWENAGAVADTPVGAQASGSDVETNSITILCDQDKYNATHVYDKVEYEDGVDRAAGFYGSAGFIHGRAIETFVAGLMRTAAEDGITCTGTARDGTLNAAMSEADLEALALAFDDALLPKEGRRLLVNSRQKHELIRAFDLKDVSKGGSTEELRNAFLTRLYGFDIYEANTNILPTADANQAMAFMADSAFWGLGVYPKAEQARQADYFRTFHSLRSRYGSKVNTLPNADAVAVTRIWLIGKGDPTP